MIFVTGVVLFLIGMLISKFVVYRMHDDIFYARRVVQKGSWTILTGRAFKLFGIIAVIWSLSTIVVKYVP